MTSVEEIEPVEIEEVPVRQQIERQYTSSEAMFIYEGEALKGSAMVELTANMTPLEIKKNLMTLDLRFDTLSKYLCNFSAVVNQHATMLNTMKTDVMKRTYNDELSDVLIFLAKAHKLRNKEFVKAIKIAERVPQEEHVEDVVMQGRNKMANKIDKVCTALDLLYGQNMELFERMENVEQKARDLGRTKADLTLVNEKHDTLVSMIHEKTDEVQKLCFDKINQNYQKTRSEIDALFSRVTECERQTLQRIRDCEELLKKRATQEYVDQEHKNLRDQIMNMLNGFNSDNTQRIEDWRLSTEESVKLIRDEMNYKLKEFRSIIKQMEGHLLERVDYEKFESTKRHHYSKIEELFLKFKDHAKKFNSFDVRFGDMMTRLTKKFDGKYGDMNDLIKDFKIRIESIEKLIQSGELGGGGGGGNQELLMLLKDQIRNESKDPTSQFTVERIEKLELQIMKLDDDTKKNSAICLNLQTDIANKIDLSTFTSQMGKKIDREEMLDMLSKFNVDDQKNKRFEKELIKMKKKLNESLEILDKKIKKLRKDLDIAYIQKILSGKANSSDVKSEVLRIDDNLKESMGLFNALRNDFENLVVSFKKIAQYIATLQEESTTGTLASTKGALCLSCGRGGPRFIPERKQVKEGNFQIFKFFSFFLFLTFFR